VLVVVTLDAPAIVDAETRTVSRPGLLPCLHLVAGWRPEHADITCRLYRGSGFLAKHESTCRDDARALLASAAYAPHGRDECLNISAPLRMARHIRKCRLSTLQPRAWSVWHPVLLWRSVLYNVPVCACLVSMADGRIRFLPPWTDAVSHI